VCVGLAQRAVFRAPAAGSARLIWGKAVIWAAFFWTVYEAVEIREAGVAVYSLIGILGGAGELALRSTSLRGIIQEFGAWSLASTFTYGVGALVFSSLLMNPPTDHFALVMAPCLIAEFGTGITVSGSVRIRRALMGLSEAWLRLRAWIRARSLIKLALVIACLTDFVLLLEWNRLERDEILRSGQDIDFWYGPEEVAALGPGLLLLCCLGLFLGKAWTCGLGTLPGLFLLKQRLDSYTFLSSEAVDMATWEGWRRYTALTGGPPGQIRSALVVVVIVWSLKSILDRVKSRHRPPA
jgi:hypothetical protein